MIATNDSRLTKHIIIMSILCIVFAALHIYYGVIVLIARGYIHRAFIAVVVQLVCGILFIIRKNPLFGAGCTAMFVFSRISTIFGGGTLLSIIIILLIVAYFVYVTYMSLQDWLERIGYYKVE